MGNAKYHVTEKGETIIDNYAEAKPFSSFFPGVAGLYGIPMWCFYVNRGQAIASFGIENKDKAILEFFPANKSYQLTHLTGFRTFLKIKRNGQVSYYEPFSPNLDNKRNQVENSMRFTPSALTLEETNNALAVKVTVTYITVPNENFPGLARKVNVENLSSEETEIEMIDGLPWVNSFGIEIWAQKNMARTAEAWVEATNIEKAAPMFKLKVVIQDKPEVEYYDCAHFYMYRDEDGSLPAIVDQEAVFGSKTDLTIPERFLDMENFSIPEYQTHENYTPSAMTYTKFVLAEKQSKTITALFGHASKISWIDSIIEKFSTPFWFDQKQKESEDIIINIQNCLNTFSSSNVFDNYCRATFLDNVLRGGLPISLYSSDGKPTVFHVYSRKHGDPERDYNHFSLQPNYFSQGNGNFRDINQNRRNDLWFNLDLLDNNLKTYYNCIQLDGHNPLVIKGSVFYIDKSKDVTDILKKSFSSDNEINTVKEWLNTPYAPGELIFNIEKKGFQLNISREEFLGSLLSVSEKIESTDHSEGYWSDHWTYNQDIVDSYLSIFPEKTDNLLFKDNTYTFYQNYAWINPRSKRYILRNGKPFQTNNVEEDHHKLSNRDIFETMVRKEKGQGEVYYTNLFVKMLSLVLNKTATLDPAGIGVELEGGKTNWNDSVNGLPGLFGSSTCEALETKRVALFLQNALKSNPVDEVNMPKEMVKFFKAVLKNLALAVKDLDNTCFSYWDETAKAKETYRKETKLGIHGDERTVKLSALKRFLKLAIKKIDYGVNKAFDEKTGVINTFFFNHVEEYDVVNDKNGEYIVPKKFRSEPTALFLQAPMHYLKNAGKYAKTQYEAVKASPLFDEKLEMFKVCASLKEMPKEMGRCTVFSAGWLENESVFLHMEYKFLLEMLKSGLHKEFFKDMKKSVVAFLDPNVYGRSILENSSFIVSSANSNEKIHGNGFVARLSGSTAEFINMWLVMNMGNTPFTYDKELSFNLNPILAGWLFNKEERDIEWFSGPFQKETRLPANHYAFVFMGKTLITYINEQGKDTFGKNGVQVKEIILKDFSGIETKVTGSSLTGELAEKVRTATFETITAILG